MSFTQTTQLNSLLLRGLQVRTNSNTPISTSYALYADGRGGTFWDQALKASDLSSYSTSVAAIAESQSTLTFYTTSSITGMEEQIIVVEQDFSTLAGSVSTQIDAAIFSFSTNQYFIDQLSSIQFNLETAVSSVYSTLSSYDNANFSTLSSYIIGSQLVSFGYTDSSISTVYTQCISTSQAALSQFSTSINNALISTYGGLSSFIDNQNSSLAIYMSTDMAATTSTNSNFISSFQVLSTQVGALEYVSSVMSSTLSTFVDSELSTSQGQQDVAYQSTFSSIFTSLELISTFAISTAEFALSTAEGFATQLTDLSTAVEQNTSDIAGLTYNFNLLTTSTLISSIYDSFVGLEQFCSTLVVSTNDALTEIFVSTTESYVSTIYSTLLSSVLVGAEALFSTILQSTSAGLTSTFVSTITSTSAGLTSTFASTITSTSAGLTSTFASTITSTSAGLTSTFASTITSTSAGLTSTFASTVHSTSDGLTSTFISTMSTLYDSYISSVQLYSDQVFTLTQNVSTATLDFANYRNFVIQVSDIVDMNPYRITYDPTDLNEIDWRTGTILIDVLSTGSYSANNGKIELDTYRWGFPTSIYESMFPTLSSADYTLMYDYRIYNSTVYTTLQNVYPRVRVYDAYDNGSGDGVGNLGWSIYSWIPLGLVGAPPFAPQVYIDIYQSTTFIRRVGPFDSSTTNTSFYINTGTYDVYIYIGGKRSEAAYTIMVVNSS
jgi:hypothetical protein